jgi:hypothetical protein
MILAKKLFVCLLIAAALGFAKPRGIGAEDASLSTRVTHNAKRKITEGEIRARAQGDLFEIFYDMEIPDISSDRNVRGETAGKVSEPKKRISALGGSLTKPSALSRLENPVITDYTSALSSVSVPAIGGKSAVPSSLGSHPDAAAVQLSLPAYDIPLFGTASRIEFMFAEYYANTDGTNGCRVSATLSFNAGKLFASKPTAQINAGWYSYNLAFKEETSWFLENRYFAPGVYSAFLAETIVRAPFFRKAPPATLYAAAGFPESPFGGFSRWTRAEFGVPFPLGETLLTFKGKVFYAADDFYTPKNSLVNKRIKAAGNISFGFFPARFVAAKIGGTFGFDSHNQTIRTRLGISVAADGLSAAVNGFFTGWQIDAEQKTVVASSDTAVGGGASVSYIFLRAKPEISASYKWYPGKTWAGTKHEYSASFSITPRIGATAKQKTASGVLPVDFIPTATVRYDASRSATRSTNEISAAATWKIKKKNFSVSAKIEALFSF